MVPTLIPGEVLAMSGQAADRLLKLDSGDAALLYLHLLRRNGLEGLPWPVERKQAALEALPEKIDVLRSIEVGLNQNPAETWDVVLTAVVDKMADVEVYAKHPAHVAAAGLLGEHKDMRACVDYEL